MGLRHAHVLLSLFLRDLEFADKAQDVGLDLPDGPKPIGDIQTGDAVLAWDEERERTTTERVEAVFRNEDRLLQYLTIDGETIITTPDHPFYTAEGWVEAGHIEVGYRVWSLSGHWGPVEGKSLALASATMFDLDVAVADTYFVGAGAWLVHNCPVGPDDLHHAWPQYLGGARLQELVSLPRALHQKFHAGLDKILARQKGKAYYDNLSPSERALMLQDLAEYTRAFDAQHGTHLFEELVKNGFPLP